MNTTDYFTAGYNGMVSHEPPYSSSDNGQAFFSGVWCKENCVQAIEYKKSRGYKSIINRSIILDFKNNSKKPERIK